MPIVLDILAVLTVVGFALFGSRRSVLSTVISIMITVVAVLAAAIFSEPVAQSLYKNHIQRPLVTQLGSAIESQDIMTAVKDEITARLEVELSDDEIRKIADSSDIVSGICDIASEKGEIITKEEIEKRLDEAFTVESIESITGDSLPHETVEQISETLTEKKDNIRAVVNAVCQEDAQKAAESLEKSFIRERAVKLVASFSAMLIFMAVNIILRLVVRLLSVLNVIPAARKLSMTAGALIGAAEGLIVLFALGYVMRYAIEHSYGIMEFINKDIIDKTFIVKFFV